MDEFKINPSELGNAKYKTNKAATLTLLIVFVLFIVLAPFCCYKCIYKDSFNITDLNFTYSHNYFYTAYVSGKLHNNSKNNYTYVSVEYTIYDYSGSNIGTAYDHISNLKAGDIWNFSAVLFSAKTQPYRCQLVKITSW